MASVSNPSFCLFLLAKKEGEGGEERRGKGTEDGGILGLWLYACENHHGREEEGERKEKKEGEYSGDGHLYAFSTLFLPAASILGQEGRNQKKRIKVKAALCFHHCLLEPTTIFFVDHMLGR